MYRIGLIALVAAGCSKPDCEAFGNRLARHEKNVNAATTVGIAAFEACKKGEAPASYVKCVLEASNQADEDKCGDGDKPAEKPKHIVQGRGFFLDLPSGWKRESDRYARILALNNEAQHVHVGLTSFATGNKDQWNDDAACKAEAGDRRAQSGASGASVELKSAELVTTKLGKACRYVESTSDLQVAVMTWALGPDTIEMDCQFDGKAAQPPDACDDIAALITIGDNR